MVQDYIGALNVYLSLPFLALFGVSVSALRLLPIMAASVTLILLFRVARESFGPLAAVLAVFLLGVNPSYVFWSRQGIFVTNITATIAMASALTALRWHRERKARHLYQTALLWGLGIYSKLLFIWMVGAAIGVAAIHRGSRWLGVRRDQAGGASRSPIVTSTAPSWLPRASRIATAAVCLVVPLTPLVVFNVLTGGTVTSVFSNLESSYYGVRNAAFLQNSLERLKQLLILLRGDHLWYLGDRIGNPLAQWVAAALLLLLLGVTLGSRRARSNRRILHLRWLTPLLFCFMVAIQSSFTVSDLFVTHHASLIPFLFLTVAAMAVGVLRRGGHVLLLPVLGALLCWAVIDLRGTLAYHRALAATGGHSAHSDAVYQLAEYADQKSITSPLALDWGIAAPVEYITEGRVTPVEIFGYESVDVPSADFGNRLRSSLQGSSDVYLFHVPEETVFAGRRELFDKVVVDAGLAARVEEVFYERSGRMLFVLTRVGDE
jgi:hypothetical protein